MERQHLLLLIILMVGGCWRWICRGPYCVLMALMMREKVNQNWKQRQVEGSMRIDAVLDNRIYRADVSHALARPRWWGSPVFASANCTPPSTIPSCFRFTGASSQPTSAATFLLPRSLGPSLPAAVSHQQSLISKTKTPSSSSSSSQSGQKASQQSKALLLLSIHRRPSSIDDHQASIIDDQST
jgi:hypothetical protein